ncbi:MAG: Dam family site-specific DNA-(adenine-N6)-methyltransferase [Pseudomonadota bacterium]
MEPVQYRPFLKWAGGKYRLLKPIRALLPRGSLLIEPFAGAGSVFLNTDYDHYWLNDINPHLIALYQSVKDEGPKFVHYAKRYFTQKYNDEDAYYTLRDQFNSTRHPRLRSALFLYLNRHGYNGLCRFNQQGKYNVPFGHYVKPYFPERELQHFFQKAQQATFFQKDYRELFERAPENAVIYCDPPYAPSSSGPSFTNYSGQGFNWSEQEHLAKLARAAAKRGIPVLLSNHDTPEVRALYKGAKMRSIAIKRPINTQIHRRNEPVLELLAFFAPK